VISPKSNRLVHWFSPLLFLGVSCIVFSHMQWTLAQTGIFAAMGAIFSYLRIVSGIQIAQYTPSEKIAKVQLTLSNLISFTALFVYSIPWLLKSLAPALIYSIWGVTIISASFGMLLYSKFFAKGDGCAQAATCAEPRCDEVSKNSALPEAK